MCAEAVTVFEGVSDIANTTGAVDDGRCPAAAIAAAVRQPRKSLRQHLICQAVVIGRPFLFVSCMPTAKENVARVALHCRLHLRDRWRRAWSCRLKEAL
eukprot:scaffold197883_cov39-Tisochrysis_lutea.AAC.2